MTALAWLTLVLCVGAAFWAFTATLYDDPTKRQDKDEDRHG